MKNLLLTTALLFATLLVPLSAQAQIASLLGASDKIQVVLAGAKTTADATVHATWTGNAGPQTSSINTNGVTAVTLITGETGAPPRLVQNILVSNTDTAAITLTINHVTPTPATFALVNAIVLQPNDTLLVNPSMELAVTDSSGNRRGTANASIVRTGQAKKVGERAKAGTTAGWTVAAGNNLGTIATVAQSQTSATLVIPIDGLHVGDTITGFGVFSSINSAGNTVTLDCALRKLTIAAAATATDAAVGTGMTQVSVTAATASSASKTGLTEVVASGTQYYLLLTCTTGATTTLELDAVEINYTSS